MWRIYFQWVPSWVPFFGCNGADTIDAAVGGFMKMKEQLNAGIKQAELDKVNSDKKIESFNKKIVREEGKKKKSDHRISRANKVIQHIDEFIAV